MSLCCLVTMNLKNDWVAIVKKHITDKGYKIPESTDHFKLGIYFSNMNYMNISSKPRKVFFSKEFDCPAKFKKRVEKLKKKFEKGESIHPYLSTGISRIKNRDWLLYDWGIHHVHLGEKKEGKMFSERTDELLFIYVSNSAVYFLNVFDHDSWGNRELLTILHNNWPEVISKYKLKVVKDKRPVIPDRAIPEFRKDGITMFTQLDNGVVYFPPGMGVVSSGNSTKAVQTTKWIFHKLRKVEAEILNDLPAFKREIYEHTGKQVDILHVELKIMKGHFLIKEKNSNYMKVIFQLDEYEEVH